MQVFRRKILQNLWEKNLFADGSSPDKQLRYCKEKCVFI